MSRRTVAIVIRHDGQLANRMFQLMLALELQSRVPGAQLLGLDLPEWKLLSAVPATLPKGAWLVLRRHRFDLDQVAQRLRSGEAQGAIIEGWGMRLGHFGPPTKYAPLFATAEPHVALRDNELLLHVRGGDILQGHHRKYFPLPFSWFDHLIDSTGLQPVFIGEIGADAYSEALRQRYRGARFLAPATALADFQTLRHAPHVGLSISSFCWMATWLSTAAQCIHLPVAGLFDRNNRETDLLPLLDPRYRYYRLPFLSASERSGVDLVGWAESAAAPQRVDAAEAGKVRASGAVA